MSASEDQFFEEDTTTWLATLPPMVPWLQPSSNVQPKFVADGEPDPDVEDNYQWLQEMTAAEAATTFGFGLAPFGVGPFGVD